MTLPIIAANTVAEPVNWTGMATLELQWPVKAPGDVEFYSYDLGPRLAQLGNDSISAFSIAIAPGTSGPSPADMLITAQQQSGSILTVQLQQGVAEVWYAATFRVTTTAGRVIVRTVWILCRSLTLLTGQTPPVAVGPEGPPGQDGAGVTEPAVAIAAAGSNQASAAPLTALNSAVAAAVPGEAVILTQSGQTVINVGALPVTVYPPIGDQIETYGLNAPVSIAVGGRVRFVRLTNGGQWYAV